MIVFSELQELPYEDGVRALAAHVGEEVRIITPDLSWIWKTHYRSPTLEACHEVNRVVRQYAFVYNYGTLEATLLACGFARVTRLPSEEGTLMVEASGSGGVAPPYFEGPRGMYLRDLNVR